MKKPYWKTFLAVILMAVAGICYSCGGGGISENISEVQAESLGETVLTESETESQAPVYHYVHVCGEVKHPGVYRVLEGSRVFQAVELAGGFTDEAASEYLNLAELTEDGLKIDVPSVEDVQSGLLPQPGEEASGKVNINRAGTQELMTLTGIGEARAADIIKYREENGGFQSVEDIMKVPGIKEGAFEKIKDQISV